MVVKKNSFNWIPFVFIVFLIIGSFILYNFEKPFNITLESLIKDYNEAKTDVSYNKPTTFGKIVLFFLSGFQVSENEPPAENGEENLPNKNSEEQAGVVEENSKQTSEAETPLPEETTEENIEINPLPEETSGNISLQETNQAENTTKLNKTNDFQQNISKINQTETITNQTSPQISPEPIKAKTGNFCINSSTENCQITAQNHQQGWQDISEINQTLTENLTISETNQTIYGWNFTLNEKIIQYSAKLGEPVKWKKTLKIDAGENKIINNLEITLPKTAGEVSVKKILEDNSVEELKVNVKNEKIIEEIEPVIFITGQAVENNKKNNFFNNLKVTSKIFKFFRNFFTLVGKAIDVFENDKEVLVNIQEELEDNDEIEIEYFTEAPYSEEIIFNDNHKEINIVGSEALHYENVLAFSNLLKEVSSKDKINLYWLKNNSKELIDFNVFDKDNNKLIDYIEWIVPSLSNQTYEIILVTKAQHLDLNKNFISDIYEQVKALDGNWSEQIKKNEYVRVTFEKNLTSSNDITFYARSNRPGTFVEAYSYNSSQLIAASAKFFSEGYYSVYLTNMTGEHNIFDLKIINLNPAAYAEFEHIIDPKKINPDYEEFIKIYNVANLNESGRTNNGTLVGIFNNTDSVNFTAGQSYRIEIYVSQIKNSTGELKNPFHEKIQGDWIIDINGSDAPNITIINGTISTCQNLNIVIVQGVGQDIGTQKITWKCFPPEITIEDLNQGDQVKLWYIVDIPLNASNNTNNAHFFGKSVGLNDAEITNSFKTLISNIAPTNPTPLINSTDGSNKTKQDLNCFSTISDPNLDKLNVTVKWIKNSTEYLSIDYNNSFSSGTFFSAFLDSGNTTKGEIWSCGMKIFDGEFFSNLTFSQNLAILNTLPITNLILPEDGNITTNRTPTFIWNASDDDNDILTSDLNISCYPGCSSDNRFFSSLNNSNFTLENDLQFLSDNNFYYNWTARADDGEVFGEWSEERRINIQALLIISLINDSVDFGELVNNESKNTTSESPGPLIIQNDGNSFLNISVNVTSIFSSTPSPTSNYQLKIDNSTEPGAFDWFHSLIDWFNAPITTTMAIVRLNHSDLTDTARIDLLIKVPDDESAGNKSSIITFTSSLGE